MHGVATLHVLLKHSSFRESLAGIVVSVSLVHTYLHCKLRPKPNPGWLILCVCKIIPISM